MPRWATRAVMITENLIKKDYVEQTDMPFLVARTTAALLRAADMVRAAPTM